MSQKDFMKIFINIFVILFLFFVVFFFFIKIMRIIDFYNKVDIVLKSANSSKDIKEINSNLNYYNDDSAKNYDPLIAHYAEELGYKNDLYGLNGMEWRNGINILLVGTDKKTFNYEKSRADVIIVLRIINTGKILSISIPRDTLIELKETEWLGYKDKIGHSLYWEGMDNLKKSIEDLLGSPIYKIAVIDNFNNFEAFLAILGGINIDKKLVGNTGIKWIRNRNFKDGDIERCKRHQVFLKKTIVKLWNISKNGNYFYTKFLYDAFKSILQTDLTKDDILNIVYILKKNNFNPEKDFLTGVLPGEFGKYDSVLINRNEVVCWIPDNEMLDKLKRLMYSEKDSYKSIIKTNIGFFDYLKIKVKNIKIVNL